MFPAMANHCAPRRTRTAATATAVSAMLALPVLIALPANAASSGDPTTRVLELTNAGRAQAGCGELTRDARIDEAAESYAKDMESSGRFSHDGADGSDFSDRLEKQGYSKPGGENIAQGQGSADAVMDAWMNSAGHRKNILDCSFTTIGIGHADGQDYWVQDFGR